MSINESRQIHMSIASLEPAVCVTKWPQIQTLRFLSFLELVLFGAPDTAAVPIYEFQQAVCTALVISGIRFDRPDLWLVETGPAVHVDVTSNECLFHALVGCSSV